MAISFRHILIAVVVPVAVGGVVLKLKSKTSDPASVGPLAVATQTPGPVGQDDVGAIEEVTPESSSAPGAEARYRYAHKDPVFSFQYPKGFSVGAFKDESGQTILVQDAQSGGKQSFQVYLSPLEEPLVVTKERIMQDVPGTVMQGPQEVKVGGAQGVAFKSKNESGVATREVWFAHGPWLYQVSGFEGSEASITTIMSSWKFD